MPKSTRPPFQTIRDLLRHAITQLNTAEAFFGHGSANAYDEAAYLILHTLKLPLDLLDPFLDARLTAAEIDAVLSIIDRRSRLRVPAAYLTNQAWLGEHKFYVDERVIVPRSFIAELIPGQLAPWVARPAKVTRILDMCTGSGCLAILLALAFPQAEVDAVDVSRDALTVAARNVNDYALESRVHLVKSDGFKALHSAPYDLIISNPPYVDAAAMAKLPKEYRKEPQLALAGGSDGLDFVKVLLREAPARLKRGGQLLVELGHNRAALEAAFPKLAFNWLSVSGGDDLVFLLGKDQLV